MQHIFQRMIWIFHSTKVLILLICFSIFVSPLFSLYLSLCLPLSVIFLVYNPTFFRPVRLYELLLYLNFRIVLERVKQKEEYDKL